MKRPREGAGSAGGWGSAGVDEAAGEGVCGDIWGQGDTGDGADGRGALQGCGRRASG